MKLTKSQRVKTIQDIATHLNPDDWTTIDLTLQQFDLPMSHDWSGDKKAYVVQMIQGADDSVLVELGQHFGVVFEGGEDNPKILEMPYWRGGELRAFISHLSEHWDTAASLQTALGRYGVSCFVAHNDIHPTLEWQIEIENALSTCDLLIALFHPDFVTSRWCDQEIGYAMGRGLPVFAVKYDADPHGFVGRFQAFSGKGKTPDKTAKELFDAALKHKKLYSKMADVVIDLFINSDTFATAKLRAAYVEQLETWDESYSARLTKALSTNNQLSGSWGVSDQVAKILTKWKAK